MIGGPGAFMIVAEDYTAFASAIMSKLLLEIAGETPPPPARRGRGSAVTAEPPLLRPGP